MKRVFFCVLIGVTSLSLCVENSEKQFSMDELVENADFSNEPPVARDLPWYITIIEKPASRLLFAMCDAWDWLHTKSIKVLRKILFFKVWQQRESVVRNDHASQTLERVATHEHA